MQVVRIIGSISDALRALVASDAVRVTWICSVPQCRASERIVEPDHRFALCAE